MSGSNKDEDYTDDTDFSMESDDDDTGAIEIWKENNAGKKIDALRRIEEYRFNRELKRQVEFFDDEDDDIF